MLSSQFSFINGQDCSGIGIKVGMLYGISLVSEKSIIDYRNDKFLKFLKKVLKLFRLCANADRRPLCVDIYLHHNKLTLT